MRLHELAHRISTDIQLLIPRPEHRLLLLDYVRSGFDVEGHRMEHAEYQRDMLRAIDDDPASPVETKHA